MRLADNKFLDLEVVSEKNLHNCLTYLTYSKQKDEVQDTYIKSNGSKKQKFHYESSLKGALLYASSLGINIDKY